MTTSAGGRLVVGAPPVLHLDLVGADKNPLRLAEMQGVLTGLGRLRRVAFALTDLDPRLPEYRDGYVVSSAELRISQQSPAWLEIWEAVQPPGTTVLWSYMAYRTLRYLIEHRSSVGGFLPGLVADWREQQVRAVLGQRRLEQLRTEAELEQQALIMLEVERQNARTRTTIDNLRADPLYGPWEPVKLDTTPAGGYGDLDPLSVITVAARHLRMELRRELDQAAREMRLINISANLDEVDDDPPLPDEWVRPD